MAGPFFSAGNSVPPLPRRGILPMIELVCLSSRGLILRSDQFFDLGDTMALGLHFQDIVTSPGQVGQCLAGLEGCVVQCRRIGCEALEFEVTLAFMELDAKERRALEAAGEFLALQSPLNLKIGTSHVGLN